LLPLPVTSAGTPPFFAFSLLGAVTGSRTEQYPFRLSRQTLVEDIGKDPPEVRMIGRIQQVKGSFQLGQLVQKGDLQLLPLAV
jgi:hypothetical protein